MGTADPQAQIDFGFADFDTDSAIFGFAAPQLSLVPVNSGVRCWRYRFAKRAIDILGSVAMVIVSLIPGLVIAATILISSKGPVFYREERIGRGGKTFLIWKFRSMRAESLEHGWFDAAEHFEVLSRLRTNKDLDDPRVTAVGRILRRWSLDELPQLFNVMTGEMSLVGPRPVVASELRLYQHLLGYYLEAKPGMSGLWQVSGRSNVAFSTRAKLDASYVKSWCLRYDFAILVRTLPAVMQRVGAR